MTYWDAKRSRERLCLKGRTVFPNQGSAERCWRFRDESQILQKFQTCLEMAQEILYENWQHWRNLCMLQAASLFCFGQLDLVLFCLFAHVWVPRDVKNCYMGFSMESYWKTH